MTSPSVSPARGARQLAVLFLLLLWLEAGYAAALALLGRLPWGTAVWQGAVCVLANPVLLLVVINVLSFAKEVRWLSCPASAVFHALLDLSQFALPWVGWSALLWLMNAARLSSSEILSSAGAITALSYLTGFAALVIFRPRSRDVRLTCHEVRIPRLPELFDGYQILHLSDLHGGGRLPVEAAAARLGAAFSLDPDLIVFTGDLAAGGPRRTEAMAELLAGLAAKDGMVAVLGNHDHWIGEERVTAALSRAGIEVLGNSHSTLSRGGSTLYLAGVKDGSYLKRDDLGAALRGIPDGAPVILLSHTPSIVHKPLAARASLVLSGHTHGGQVVLPWIGPIHVPSRIERRFASGLHRVDGRWLFVNRGLGEIFPPIRINCPPEIALLTLRSVPTSH